MSAREKMEAARSAYASAGKSLARAVVVGLARTQRAATVLDLWGGGASARAFREALPDAVIVSAESDEELQPGLLADAQAQGYAFHMGNAADAPGTYDLVWLDFCAQASLATEQTLRAVATKVARDGHLAVTIMPAREGDRVLTGASRLRHLPLWIEEVTGMTAWLLLPYRRAKGLSMWLLILDRRKTSAFSDEKSFEDVATDIARRACWLRKDAPPLPPEVRDMLDAAVTTREPDFDRIGRRDDPDAVVRINDLTLPMRSIVMALLDAHDHAVRRDVETIVPTEQSRR